MKEIVISMLSILVLGTCAPKTMYSQERGTWNSTFQGSNGINGQVYAIVSDNNGNVYVGGAFSSAGGIAVNNIAQWTGSEWKTLGKGFDHTVLAIGISGEGNIFAGGSFIKSDTIDVNGIAKWNGEAWLPIEGGIKSDSPLEGTPSVNAIAFDSEGGMYIGGNFNQAGSIQAVGIARWDENSWSSVGVETISSNPCGDTPRNNVSDLAIDNAGAVYVTGNFVEIGNLVVNGVAKWNGEEWSSLGKGATDMAPCNVSATAIELYKGDIYATGRFLQIDGTDQGIAKWNGQSWESVGGHIESGGIISMSASQDGIYVVGKFTQIGGVAAQNVSKWSEDGWYVLGEGVTANVGLFAVNVKNNNIFVGGIGVTEAGGNPSSNIAVWEILSPVGVEIKDEHNYGTEVFPNPFSDHLIIQYHVPLSSESRVHVNVFNLLGQRIDSMFDNTSFPGTHQIMWNVPNIAAGPYVLKLEIGKKYQSVLVYKN